MFMKHKLSEGHPTWIKSGRDYARELVRTRDGHTCQGCAKKWVGIGRRFHVHHLGGLCGKKSRGYDSVNNVDSLTTLCQKCHIKLHDKKRYGRSILPNHKAEVLELRKNGITYDAIGKRFDVSSQAVYFFVNGRKKKTCA